MLSLMMVVALSVSSQVPIYPTAVTDPVSKVSYYPCDPPPNPPDVLRLTVGQQTVLMKRNATTGTWEGTVTLPKPIACSHPVTGAQIITDTFDYRLRKHFDNLVFQDRKTPSWTTYEAAMVPSGCPIPDSYWSYPDTGIRFSPFFYGRTSIGVIRE